MKLWYVNGATGEIDSYTQEDTLTDFPRGVLMAYGDAIVTRLNSKEDAERWLKEWKCIKEIKGAFRVIYRWVKRGEESAKLPTP